MNKPKYMTGPKRQLALARTLGYAGYRHLSLRELLALNKLLASEKLVRHEGRYVINSFLPPFPSRAFASLARGVADLKRGIASPVSAYLAITDACRYKCPHCSKAGRKGEPLTFDAWKRVIKEAQDLGVSIIGFTGGEPLCEPRLEELVASVDERSISLLFTAGDGLKFERAKALKEAGLFGAAVSLDSFDRVEHDKGRGRAGAWKSAVSALVNCNSAGLYTMSQIVATKARCDEGWMRRYLEFVKGMVHEVRLLEPMPCGKLLGADDWRITREQHEWLKRIHIESNRDREAVKVSSFAFIEDESRYGCGAGFQHFYVDVLGNVQPCDFTPISFGNVRRESLSAILARMQKALVRPHGKCFMLENGARLANCPCTETPLPAARAAEVVDLGEAGELPAFYKALGWMKTKKA